MKVKTRQKERIEYFGTCEFCGKEITGGNKHHVLYNYTLHKESKHKEKLDNEE